MQHSVMIFAAGFGTRMRHLTKDRPKPMIEVAGRPLIDHAIDLARDLPASAIVTNLHYKAEVLERHLQGSGVKTVLEKPEILDTGGGLRNALPHLVTGAVLTLNSDAIWKGPNPLKHLQRAWEPDKMDALLMSVPRARAVGFEGPGNFLTDAQGRVKRGDGLVFGGAQIMKTDLLHDVDEACFSLNQIWDLMIDQKRLYTVEYEGFWCDVGHPDGITQAENLLGNDDV